MKVVFTDIDGMLNNFKDRNFGEKFSATACKNFNSLLKKVPDLKIVVSSAWRTHGIKYLKEVFHLNGIDSDRIIDVTGKERGSRGYQIQCWLDRNPGVTSFVILDDESDMGDLLTKLVKTNSFVGLTSKEVRLALQVLGQK